MIRVEYPFLTIRPVIRAEGFGQTRQQVTRGVSGLQADPKLDIERHIDRIAQF